MKKRIAITLFLFSIGFIKAVSGIDLEKIMKTNDFIGFEPDLIRWSEDSKLVYFQWKNPEDKQVGTYSFNALTNSLTRLTSDQVKELPDQTLIWNKSKTKGLKSRDGSIHLVSVGGNRSTPIIENIRGLRILGWNQDASGFYFLTQDSLCSFSLSVPHWRVLLRFGEHTKKMIEQKSSNTAEKYLREEEKKLIRNYPSSAFSGFGSIGGVQDSPPDFILEKGERMATCMVSPDESVVVISLYNMADSGDSNSADIPVYISSTAYTRIEKSRDKAGAANLIRQRFCLYSLRDRKRLEVKANETNTVISSLTFSPGGKLIGWADRLDSHDAWLNQYNAQGEVEKVILHLHDDAWLQRGFFRMQYLFLPDRDQLLTLLEKDDHIRLVFIDLNGKTKSLTGDYEVDDFDLSDDGRTVTYVSSEGHPGIRNTYLLDLQTGRKRALTQGNGFHRAYLSPDQKKWVSVESDEITPPELYFYQAGKKTRITVSPPAEFRALQLQRPEVIRFPASDGVPVYARLMRPANKNGAAVLFVHGAGYLQDAHLGWSEYWREFLFANLLVERGYTFLDIDYRGSSGYGRNFRTGIYGFMGNRDLHDLLDGVKVLVEKEAIDPKRIGIFGGSYGGFLTLMGLFQSPDTFACGAALRPVTDWAHYSSYYTNPILGGKPQDVPENYRRSSPIYFAENLQKPLLILHGMADDNVHFQDSVRLAERLIELKKTNWWLTGFPSERHTFTFAESWFDEYRRILELFETWLQPRS